MAETAVDYVPVTVIDAIMGTGKSKFLIRKIINTQPQKKFLIVLPTLSECGRYRNEITADSFEPKTRGTKLEDLQRLIKRNGNIVTTHALIQKIDDETLKMLGTQKYTLIIDECLDTVHKYERQFKASDRESIFADGYVYADDYGYLHWNRLKEEQISSNPYDGRWNDIKRLCDLNSLMCLRPNNEDHTKKVVMWTMPIKFFTLFEECYIATYLWEGSLHKCYFDLNHVDYRHMTLVEDDAEESKDNLKLADYDQALEREKRKQFYELISFCDDERYCGIGQPEKRNRYPLSSSWYKRMKRAATDTADENTNQLRVLKNHLYNYFRNIAKTPSKLNMWTTFGKYESLLGGNGYKKGFVPLNAKGTNDYRHKESLAYTVNRFIDPEQLLFFSSYGVKLNQDLFAVSELLQWIWRSRIRDGKAIRLYLPSSRMKDLLDKWAAGEL